MPADPLAGLPFADGQPACDRCGYDVRAVIAAGEARCPECGRPLTLVVGPDRIVGPSWFATVAAGFGIVGWALPVIAVIALDDPGELDAPEIVQLMVATVVALAAVAWLFLGRRRFMRLPHRLRPVLPIVAWLVVVGFWWTWLTALF